MVSQGGGTGNATAMFNVGNCYAHGYGIPQDDEQAAEWYQKASGTGNKKAASALRHLAPSRKKRKNRMRRPEKTLLLFTRIGESLFAAQQPSRNAGKKYIPMA